MTSRWSGEYQRKLWDVVRAAVENWPDNEGRIPVKDFLAVTVSVYAGDHPDVEGPWVDSADLEILLLEGALTHLASQKVRS